MYQTFQILDENGRSVTIPYCVKNQPINVVIKTRDKNIAMQLVGNNNGMFKHIQDVIKNN